MHKIKVVDNNGLTATSTVTLSNLYDHPFFTLATEIQPSSCGSEDGKIVLTATGTAPPYKYSLDGFDFQISNSFSGLSSGHYLFTVGDENGCQISQAITLPDKCANSINYTYTPVVCLNEGSVIATANPSGALPMKYSLDGVSYQTSGTFNNLTSGLYHLYSMDNNSIVAINAFVIQQHCGIGVSATTTQSRCSSNDGTITASIQGGISPFFIRLMVKIFKTVTFFKT